MSDSVEAISPSAARAAREVRVVFSRLRRRLREIGGAHDLTPSQTAVLSRLLKDGAATASGLAAAEGVESQAQAAFLAGLGCDELQGNGLGAATPVIDAERYFVAARGASSA